MVEIDDYMDFLNKKKDSEDLHYIYFFLLTFPTNSYNPDRNSESQIT